MTTAMHRTSHDLNEYCKCKACIIEPVFADSFRGSNSMGTLTNHGCNETTGAHFNLERMLQSHKSRLVHGWGGKSFLSFCVWGETTTAEDRSGCGYNEVLLDADVWRNNLPGAIEAFFYPVNGVADNVETTVSEARGIYQTFLMTYELSSKVVPLLEFDISVATADGGHEYKRGLLDPFRPAECSEEDHLAKEC